MLFSWHCMYLGHEREIQPGGQQQHNHSFTKKQTITPISILSQKAANEIGALWATPPFTIQHYNQPCGFLFQMYMWNFHGRYMSTFFIVHTIKCGILFYITKKNKKSLYMQGHSAYISLPFIQHITVNIIQGIYLTNSILRCRMQRNQHKILNCWGKKMIS